jgi:hypothetical protein
MLNSFDVKYIGEIYMEERKRLGEENNGLYCIDNNITCLYL